MKLKLSGFDSSRFTLRIALRALSSKPSFQIAKQSSYMRYGLHASLPFVYFLTPLFLTKTMIYSLKTLIFLHLPILGKVSLSILFLDIIGIRLFVNFQIFNG